MVKIHAPTAPQLLVVKRRRSVPLARRRTCLWPGCNANLATDHDLPVCGCHRDARIPHHRNDRLVLHLLFAAFPAAIDLCGVLRCTSHELEPTLKRLRRRGHVVAGARRGYVYEMADSQWR